MWIDHDIQSSYRSNGGAIEAIVQADSRHGWQWKVGVLQNGRTEWSLGGDAESRQQALVSAKAMVSLMEFALGTGDSVTCG